MVGRIAGKIVIRLNSDDQRLSDSYHGYEKALAHEMNHADTYIIVFKRWAKSKKSVEDAEYKTEIDCNKAGDGLKKEFEQVKSKLNRTGSSHGTEVAPENRTSG
jgi:hypothetical protein